VDLYPYPTAPLYFNSRYGKNGSGKISPAEEGSPLSRLLEAAKPPARLVLARAWQVSSRRASGAAGKISPAEEGSPLSRLLEAAKPPARLVLARAWQVSSRRASGAAGVPSTVRVNGDVLYMRCEMLRRAFLCGIEAKRPPGSRIQ
jgi:hypothetical protein